MKSTVSPSKSVKVSSKIGDMSRGFYAGDISSLPSNESRCVLPALETYSSVFSFSECVVESLHTLSLSSSLLGIRRVLLSFNLLLSIFALLIGFSIFWLSWDDCFTLQTSTLEVWPRFFGGLYSFRSGRFPRKASVALSVKADPVLFSSNLSYNIRIKS